MKESVEKDSSTHGTRIVKDNFKQESNTNMPASTAPTPQVFTDEELSEIFQIDFGEIFGSPDEGIKPSKYKGVQLPPPSTPSSAQKSNGNLSNRNKEEQTSIRGKEQRITSSSKNFDLIVVFKDYSINLIVLCLK